MNDCSQAIIKLRRVAMDIVVDDRDVALVSLLFFNLSGGNSGTVYSACRYLLIAYLFFKNLRRCKDILLPVILLGSFSILMGFSTLINTDSLTWAFSGFMFGIGIVATILVFVDACERLSPLVVLKHVTVVFAFILLINDLLILILPYNRENPDTAYLVGNKFIVSYAHCLLSGLLLVGFKDKVALNRIVAIFGAAMSYLAGSTIGTVMMLAMLVMTFTPKKAKPYVANPLSLILAVAILNILIWGPIDLFNRPEFQDFIVNVLHKSANMTGRDRLYAATLDFVAEKPILGWGYLTDIYRNTFGYGNAQNGLFHLVTQCGILGTAVYFAGLLAALVEKPFCNVELFGLYVFLLTMVLGSSVEINLSFQFAFGIAIVCGIQHATKNNGEAK